ncbi:protein Daple-like [Trifolium pratense]|uniref:protein Daple-like n=1 Tax=Trifolium pratense TaxID=57577 RepID=UPI001E692C8A|nr:protein Daple-like [Trifolium pratense]
MNIQPKIEPGSPSTNHVILDRDEDETYLNLIETPHNFEDKTIPDLVEVLRGACLQETFDKVESVLVSKDLELRNKIQLLEQNVEMEKLGRLKAEEEVKKREELCEEGKKVQQRYLALLKEVKIAGLVDHRETIDVLRKRNVQLRELCEKGKREVQNYEAMFKEAEIALLVDRDALKEVKKKNIEFECEVKKIEEKRMEDRNELQVLKLKYDELVSRVLELKEKRLEDGNALDVLRKMKDGLEHEVLELKRKKVEDEKSLVFLKLKNGELEYEVLEFRKLKEKWGEDTNDLGGIREKNAELENEVLELKKKWLNDSNALEELRSKVRVLEDDKKASADIEIKNGELKQSVNNNLATISKLKNENNNLYIKFIGLLERVAKVEDDTKLLMSVDASGGRNNDGEAAIASTRLQNKWGMDALGASSASGRLKMEKDIDDDQRMSRGVHEKNTISGIAAKNGHPTPSSSIAVDMSKRKHSMADTETSSSGSSCCDLSYLDDLASSFEVSEAKKKKM